MVDHDAVEAEIAHATFELIGGTLGVLHRDMSEPGIAGGSLGHFFRQPIIGCRGELRRLGGIGLDLHAGTRDRQHRPDDTGGVHGGEPLFAEIRKPPQQIGLHVRRDRRQRLHQIVHEGWYDEMFLQCDLRQYPGHCGCRHGGWRSNGTGGARHRRPHLGVLPDSTLP